MREEERSWCSFYHLSFSLFKELIGILIQELSKSCVVLVEINGKLARHGAQRRAWHAGL